MVLTEPDPDGAKIDHWFAGNQEALRDSEDSPDPLLEHARGLEEVQMPRNLLHIGTELRSERDCGVWAVPEELADDAKPGGFGERGENPECGIGRG